MSMTTVGAICQPRSLKEADVHEVQPDISRRGPLKAGLTGSESEVQTQVRPTTQLMIRRLHRGLAWLILVGLAAEVYLVGARLFGVTTFQPHRVLGWPLAVAILLLLVLALVADRRRRILGLSTLLVALTIFQVLLPSLGTGLPWVAALHAINTMALMGATATIARSPGAELINGDSYAGYI